MKKKHEARQHTITRNDDYRGMQELSGRQLAVPAADAATDAVVPPGIAPRSTCRRLLFVCSQQSLSLMETHIGLRAA